MNDLCDVVEECDDKMSLMHETNKESFFAINTPFGQTRRIPIKNIEMQGSVLGPIKASVYKHKIGKSSFKKRENLYFYKKSFGIP